MEPAASIAVKERLFDHGTMRGPAAARVTIDDREYINFVGSGYLALSQVPEIRAAARQALEDGAPFSRQFPSDFEVIDPIFQSVERCAAAACGTEASVYFASGYFIGMVGLASLSDRFDLILIDETAHYSLKDAAKLTGLRTFAFAHCDTENVARLLKQHVGAGERPLLVTDGVFATTGALPPLADYAKVCTPYNAKFFVDESHGFGVVGSRGRGSAEYFGVEHMAATGTTLTKALCGQGAIVGGTAATIARLRALPVIRGACAGSPLSAAAAAAGLEYVAAHPALRNKLSAMTSYFRQQLRQLGLHVIDSPAPIVSFQHGRREDMQALQRKALARGVYIYLSNYIGAGPEGMIRCALFANHTLDDIDALLDLIRE
jgi:8-amino-7-oxononanoate synthase